MARFVKDIFISRPIKDISLYEPLGVLHDARIEQVVELFRTNNIGSAVVYDDMGLITGIITERDIIQKVIGKKPDSLVSDIMTPDPRRVKDTSSIGRAIFDMQIEKIRHLPVVKNQSMVLGMISAKDLVDYVYRIIVKTHERLSKVQQSLATEFLKNTVDVLHPKPAKFVLPDATLKEVVETLQRERIGSLVVCDENKKPLGIITERDIVRKIPALYEFNETLLVELYMSENPTTLLQTASVSDAFRHMSEGKFRHLPTVSAEGKLVGMLSVRDFLAVLGEGIVEDLST